MTKDGGETVSDTVVAGFFGDSGTVEYMLYFGINGGTTNACTEIGRGKRSRWSFRLRKMVNGENVAGHSVVFDAFGHCYESWVGGGRKEDFWEP